MTNLTIDPEISELTSSDIEGKANALLERYNREVERVFVPPIPVEKIADNLLKLQIDWVSITDVDEAPILALIEPGKMRIQLNENRLDHFAKFSGSEQFTYAHEIGHFELHTIEVVNGPGNTKVEQRVDFLCRGKQSDLRETQANYFASCLLMPRKFVDAAIGPIELNNLKPLYRLTKYFGVTITALSIRLTRMGLVRIHGKEVEDLRRRVLN